MDEMELKDCEKQLFNVIQQGDTEEALSLLRNSDIRISCLDEDISFFIDNVHNVVIILYIKNLLPIVCLDTITLMFFKNGMTLLDQASYKGNVTLVEELLKLGANPNSNEHKHGYTALMFAAISGKSSGPEICRILLDAGAHSYATNSINKTAAELAAFVGQNECVSVINTYISIDEIDKFLHPQGKNSPEQYPRELCLLLHATTRTHNIHPVKVILFVAENEVLMKYRKKYLYVVDRVFERQLRSKQPNEAMSIKLWLILCILRETFKFMDSLSGVEKEVKEKLLLYVKFLLKMEATDVIRPKVDLLLRNAVRGFPYHQSVLFQMLVKLIAETKLGCEPGAYKCILQVLFGPALVTRSIFCACCGVPNATKRCPSCHLAYCGSKCQKLDWKIHKKCCAAIAEQLKNQPEPVTSDLIISSGGGVCEPKEELLVNEMTSKLKNLEIFPEHSSEKTNDKSNSADICDLNDVSIKEVDDLEEKRELSKSRQKNKLLSLLEVFVHYQYIAHLLCVAVDVAMQKYLTVQDIGMIIVNYQFAVCKRCHDLAIRIKMFIEEVNPLTGEVSWRVESEYYDLAQEIARSRFGDMLHDIERNHLYQAAIHSVINQMHKAGEVVHAIDIGTGTGLLAMMAVKAGAASVTAVEMFKPMADCAKTVFYTNGLQDKIKLLSQRSTDLQPCAEEGKANCIIAEVFDTELIGEGALRTFKEAHETVAKSCCRVVPSSAKIMIAPVKSDFLKLFHQLPNQSLRCPFMNCSGSSAVFDLQLSNMSPKLVELLCKPFEIFRFNFEDGNSIKYDEMAVKSFVVESKLADSLDAIIMWWDLDMDGTGRFIMSTAPKWWNPYAQWRDHWMQGVYYLPHSVPVKHGQTITFVTFENFSEVEVSRPYCSCGIHSTCSRNAIYRINMLDTDENLKNFLEKNFRKKNIITVNAGSLIGLIAAKYANFVTILEYNDHFRRALIEYANANSLTNLKFIRDEAELDREFLAYQSLFKCYVGADSIVSEPYFFSSLLPWDNLRIWHTFKKINATFGYSKALTIFPSTFILNAIPLYLEDLWKIVAPVGVVEGFNLSPFDDICEKAQDATDDLVEAHSLWEYSNLCAGDMKTVIAITMNNTCLEQMSFENSVTLQFRPRTANAVALWVQWCSDDYQLDNGPVGEIKVGQNLDWAVGQRQGVYFFPERRRSDPTSDSITITAQLNLATTPSPTHSPLQLSFQFEPVSKSDEICKLSDSSKLLTFTF
uniref:MYND-type domain-containing protein n=1 Tax=Syphacia muris TaxID=451379 RepID=A0A158R408_9BILA